MFGIQGVYLAALLKDGCGQDRIVDDSSINRIPCKCQMSTSESIDLHLVVTFTVNGAFVTLLGMQCESGDRTLQRGPSRARRIQLIPVGGFVHASIESATYLNLNVANVGELQSRGVEGGHRLSSAEVKS